MIVNLLLYIWQLLQNILGFIVKLITRAEKGFAGHYYWNLRSGLSLGHYIFVNERALVETVKHEEGHQKQSKMLGPLYLLIIGVPSFVWASLKYFGFFKSRSYYSFYTEKWADRLARIERSSKNT